MKYPLIDQNDLYPEEPLCPICKKNKVFEPHNFVVLEGGALYTDERGDSLFPEGMKGFLDLIFHGHHHENIEDDKKDIYESLYIVKESNSGQFSLYFCSTDCLRNFFNQLVDEFEKKIKKTKS